MKYLSTILLLLPLCAGCSSDWDIDRNIPIGKKAQIGFSSRMHITRAVTTLADIQTDDNGFSVWGGYEGNTVFDGRKVIYDDSNSEWGYEDTKYWTYNIYDFHGVYPTPDANSTDKNYDVTWNNTTKELNITGFDASSGIDLLHSPLIELDGSDTNISGKPIEMNFNHILTNVNVELVKAAENSIHDIRITQVVIYGLCTKGDYSWTKENVLWDTDESSISYISKEINNIADLKVKSDNANDNYGYTSILSDVLCIPQDINENSIYLGVAYDFKLKTAAEYITGNSMIVALPTTYNWGIGEKVTYRATIDAHMNLEFGTPGIEAWGEEPESGTIIIK
jgi:hypothetical protein